MGVCGGGQHGSIDMNWQGGGKCAPWYLAGLVSLQYSPADSCADVKDHRKPLGGVAHWDEERDPNVCAEDDRAGSGMPPGEEENAGTGIGGPPIPSAVCGVPVSTIYGDPLMRYLDIHASLQVHSRWSGGTHEFSLLHLLQSSTSCQWQIQTIGFRSAWIAGLLCGSTRRASS